MAAPVVDGEQLQASHVTIDGDLAFVSYNLRGSEYSGGIDVIDITDVDTPKIVSELLLRNTDVNSIDYDNGLLYLAEAINEDLSTPLTLNSPAALEVFNVANGIVQLNDSRMLDLSSYATTSVLKHNNKLVVATGDNGHLYHLDELNAYTPKQKISLTDLRSIKAYGDKKVVLQGNPAALKVYSSDFQLEQMYTLPQALTAASKSEFAIQGDYAYIPTNEYGLKVMNLNNGNLVKEIPKPSTPAGGNPADYVTNSVEVLDDILLIANGGAGLYCGELNEHKIPKIKDVANLGASANFVEAKRNSNGDIIIFVATGTGGLNIFEYEKILSLPGEGDHSFVGPYNHLGAPIHKETVKARMMF